MIVLYVLYYFSVSLCSLCIALFSRIIVLYVSYYCSLLPERRFKNEAIQNPATPIG